MLILRILKYLVYPIPLQSDLPKLLSDNFYKKQIKSSTNEGVDVFVKLLNRAILKTWRQTWPDQNSGV